jgi:hypothetical protein
VLSGHWEELPAASACTVLCVMVVMAKQIAINMQPTFATTGLEYYANNGIKVT